MKKVFKLLSLFSLVILFSSNLFASSSSSSSDDESEGDIEFNVDGKSMSLPKFLIRSKDGKKFRVTGIYGARAKVYFTSAKKRESEDIPLSDGRATYIAEGSFTNCNAEYVRFWCNEYASGDVVAVYELPANEVRPGFYIREGGGLSYLRLEEIHNF